MTFFQLIDYLWFVWLGRLQRWAHRRSINHLRRRNARQWRELMAAGQVFVCRKP